MVYVDLLFALVVALMLSLVFIFFSPRRGYHGLSAAAAIWFFFVILFLGTWAGGVWVTPFGPPIWGTHWMPFVVVGILVALLLAAAAEPSRRTNFGHHAQMTEGETLALATAFGILFWILVFALAAVVVAAYFGK